MPGNIVIAILYCRKSSWQSKSNNAGRLQMQGLSGAAHHDAEFQPGERPGWLLDGDSFAAIATIAARAAHLGSPEKVGAQHLLPPTDSFEESTQRSQASLQVFSAAVAISRGPPFAVAGDSQAALPIDLLDRDQLGVSSGKAWGPGHWGPLIKCSK